MKHENNRYNRLNWYARPWTVTKLAGIFVSVGILGLTGIFFYREYTAPPSALPEPQLVVRGQETPPAFFEESAPQQEETPQEPDNGLVFEVGSLRTYEDRQGYLSGELELQIPRLGFTGPVLDGVDEAALAQGVGLFLQAQLPGQEEGHNSNTSIAGNRQQNGSEFYYIDTLETGDRIYLRYREVLYTYEVAETLIEYSDNWDPMRVREYACVTLQAEHPLGAEAYNRMYKVGRLVETAPGAPFPPIPNDLPAPGTAGTDESGTGQDAGQPPPESGDSELI